MYVGITLMLLALLAGCGASAGQTSTGSSDTPSGATSTAPATPAQTATGGVDACGWFSLNDASQVLGGPTNAPTVQKAGGSSLCTYASPSNGETMLFVVQQGSNSPNRFQLEQHAAAGSTGYQVITGLGDSAFWTPIDGVVVLKGQTLFTMQVLHVQNQALASIVPAEEQLIRTALSRLG